MTQRFRGINPADYGVKDPGAREAIFALNSEIRRALEEQEKKISSAGDKLTVTYNGSQQRLNDVIRRATVPIGSIIWMYISWSDALKLRNYGWAICDGNNGTPPLIEQEGQTPTQRFIRSVQRGNDPWTSSKANPNIGGSATATVDAHTVTITEHSFAHTAHSVSIANHDSHDGHQHILSGQTTGSVLEAPLEVNTNEPTDVAASADHTHDFAFTTDTTDPLTHSTHDINGAGATASLTHNTIGLSHYINGETNEATLSHAAVSTIPPCLECIPMMKVR